MGRPPWANPEQTAFLESYLPGLELAKKRHGLTTEYTRIARVFLIQWPARPTAEEQDKFKDPQQLQIAAENRRKKVFYGPVQFYELFLITFASKYMIGTKPVARPGPSLNSRMYWIFQARIHGNHSHTSSITPTRSVSTGQRILRFVRRSETYGIVEMKNRSSISYLPL
jgi:hypothetical protein